MGVEIVLTVSKIWIRWKLRHETLIETGLRHRKKTFETCDLFKTGGGALRLVTMRPTMCYL